VSPRPFRAQSGRLAGSVLVTGLAIEQKPGSRPTTCLLAFRSGSPAVGHFSSALAIQPS
jgi:hypothetical protein